VAIPLAGPGAERAVLARGICSYEVNDEALIGQEVIGQEVIGQEVIGWSSWLDPSRN